MDSWATIFILFISAGSIVLLVMVLKHQTGSGSLRVGQAELRIDFNRGWQKVANSSAKRKGGGSQRKENYQYWLEVKGTDWRYPLANRSPIYLGRATDNQVRLKDSTADTRQAVIYWEDNRYKINNLSTRTPTRINNRTFSKQNLGHGNTIQMGKTKLVFRQRKS